VSELALTVFAASRDAHASEGESRSARFARFAAAFDRAAYIRDLDRQRLRWVARSAAEFPERLASIHDPPPGLFLRGAAAAELLAAPAVAIVGARACSAYGRQVARRLGREAAAAGLVVVEGNLRTRTYQYEGKDRESVEITASSIVVIDAANDADLF